MLSLKDLRNLDRDDLLETLGLQRRGNADWVVPAVTALGVGLLVGAGLGLLLAPKSGNELREDLRERLQSGLDALPGKDETAKPARTPSAT
jgi:YtxH-like protein